MNQLEVSHLYKKYGKREVLSDVTMTLNPGIYGFWGPNGAGKTTLFRALTSVDWAVQGEIRWNGISARAREYPQHIGFLPQQFKGFSDLTVERMLQYFAALHNMDRKRTQQRISEVLAQVHLEEERDKKIAKLSGGMLRRLGVAQCILHDPDILVFDEPTAGLDPEERVRFRLLLRQIAEGRMILMSSHVVSDLEEISDQLVLLYEGRLLRQASASDIRRAAQGKIYTVPKQRLKEVDGEYTIVNEEKRGDGEWIRVAAAAPQPFSTQAPTLEDGYLCIIKGY